MSLPRRRAMVLRKLSNDLQVSQEERKPGTRGCRDTGSVMSEPDYSDPDFLLNDPG